MNGRATSPVVVTGKSHGLPYSKGLMASSVMAAGLSPAKAYRVAERIEEILKERGARTVTSKELRDLSASLLAEIDQRYATSYLQWQAVEELDMPLVILLGGATGVGKSTVATQLAARLGITRVVSTDAVREVLRAVFSQELMPTLYVSSFAAGTVIRVPPPASSDRVIIGFQEQVTAVSVGIKALIARALEEGTDIIIEGAHVVPGFLEGWEQEFKEAVLVPIVITVSDEHLHRTHFHLRALETRARPRDRYLSSFENIRCIQSHISELARERGVPVLEMFDLDSTLQEIARIVVAKGLEKAQVRAESAPEGVAEPGAEEAKKYKLPRLKSWEILGGRRKP